MTKTGTKLAAMLLAAMAVMFALVLGAQTAYADTKTVSSIHLSCDLDKLDLDTQWTLGQVKQRFDDNIVNTTDGASISIGGNSGISYWEEVAGTMYGIGDGSAQVDASTSYFLRCYMEFNDGYDWPDEVYQVSTDKFDSITGLDELRVYFNDIRRDDVLLQFNKYWSSLTVYIPVGRELAGAEISSNTFTYDGSSKLPKVTVVTLENGSKVHSDYYQISYIDSKGKEVVPRNAGDYSVKIKGKGIYYGTLYKWFVINKAANPLSIKAKTATVKYSKLKKKTQTLAVTKVIKFTKKGQGKMSYTLVSAKKGSKSYKKYFKISKTTGKVTVKKNSKMKKGAYSVKVKVKAAGNANYKASAVKTVTFKVKIK